MPSIAPKLQTQTSNLRNSPRQVLRNPAFHEPALRHLRCPPMVRRRLVHEINIDIGSGRKSCPKNPKPQNQAFYPESDTQL